MNVLRKAAAVAWDILIVLLVVALVLGVFVGLPALFVFAMRCAWTAGGAS